MVFFISLLLLRYNHSSCQIGLKLWSPSSSQFPKSNVLLKSINSAIETCVMLTYSLFISCWSTVMWPVYLKTKRNLSCYSPAQTMAPKDLHESFKLGLASMPPAFWSHSVSITESSNSPFQILIKSNSYCPLNSRLLFYNFIFWFFFFFFSLYYFLNLLLPRWSPDCFCE